MLRVSIRSGISWNTCSSGISFIGAAQNLLPWSRSEFHPIRSRFRLRIPPEISFSKSENHSTATVREPERSPTGFRRIRPPESNQQFEAGGGAGHHHDAIGRLAGLFRVLPEQAGWRRIVAEIL